MWLIFERWVRRWRGLKSIELISFLNWNSKNSIIRGRKIYHQVCHAESISLTEWKNCIKHYVRSFQDDKFVVTLRKIGTQMTRILIDWTDFDFVCDYDADWKPPPKVPSRGQFLLTTITFKIDFSSLNKNILDGLSPWGDFRGVTIYELKTKSSIIDPIGTASPDFHREYSG